ncbi:MAG: EamA family transporter [Chloroflexi bacterium]|nr:EamA family transporter [Chloroflexota bacterium]
MKIRIWLAMIVVYIAWGSTYLAIRYAVETMPPFLMAAARFLVSGLILYLWRRLAGDPAPSRLHWRSAAVIAAFLLVGGNGGVTWAEQRVVSGIAALVVGSSPLWMVLIDTFIPISSLRGGSQGASFRQGAAGWMTYAGVLLGFLGIVLLIGPFEIMGHAQNLDPLGVGVLLLAAFSWAAGSLYGRGARLPESPLLGSAMEMMVGGAFLLMLGSIFGEWSRLHLAAIQPASLLGLVYLILGGSLMGYVAYTWLLRNAPTPLVSTYAYVNPLIAILVGNLIASEPLTPRLLFAAAVIVGAVALINLTRNAPKPVLDELSTAVPCCED